MTTLIVSLQKIKGGNKMFAVIKTGGKQVKVTVDQEIYVEKLDANVGDLYEFNEVLATNNKIGTPYVNGAKVVAEVLKQGRQKKIIVFKFKRKKGYRRKQAHRQPYTKLVIKSIEG